MTILGDRMIDAGSVSEAWLDAIILLNSVPGRKVVHLVARIRKPAVEIAEIRAEADRLIEGSPDEPWAIDTTRNTIFPAAWARRFPEPSDLAAYYRERYDELRRVPANSKGTYFGRVVAYPRGQAEPGDQLTETVRKLRQELAGGSPKSSRYEINIYSEAVDTSPMSFPCMAHVSVHMHEGRLHMQAVYRNEYLIGRAYGNFLGLGQMQTYIASAAGLEVGELLMTINHAELDSALTPVRAAIARLEGAVLRS
jgi:thymidylate synthase